MYGNYGYGYGSSSPAGGILMLIAFVAAIVLTVMANKRYLARPGDKLVDLRDQRSLTTFLRFDTLLIERILKVLYVFFALFTPFLNAALVLSALFSNFGLGLALLVGLAIATVIGEVILRVLFESLMLKVVIARNTSEIKRALGVREDVDADGISSPAPTPAQAPVTPAARPVQSAPVQAADVHPAYSVAPTPVVPAPAPEVSAAVAVPVHDEPVADISGEPTVIVEDDAPTTDLAPEPEVAPMAEEEEPDTVSDAPVVTSPEPQVPTAPAPAQAEVPEQHVCPNCGAPITRVGAKFCGNCGSRLS